MGSEPFFCFFVFFVHFVVELSCPPPGTPRVPRISPLFPYRPYGSIGTPIVPLDVGVADQDVRIACAFVTLEASIGQLFRAMLLARLVSIGLYP